MILKRPEISDMNSIECNFRNLTMKSSFHVDEIPFSPACAIIPEDNSQTLAPCFPHKAGSGAVFTGDSAAASQSAHLLLDAANVLHLKEYIHMYYFSLE